MRELLLMLAAGFHTYIDLFSATTQYVCVCVCLAFWARIAVSDRLYVTVHLWPCCHVSLIFRWLIRCHVTQNRTMFTISLRVSMYSYLYSYGMMSAGSQWQPIVYVCIWVCACVRTIMHLNWVMYRVMVSANMLRWEIFSHERPVDHW